MSRYGSGSGKKPTKSTLLFPVLVSFFVGIGGILYVYDNYRSKSQAAKDFAVATSGQDAAPDKLPNEIKATTEADLALKAQAQAETTPETKPASSQALTQPEQLSGGKQAPLPDLLASDTVARQALVRLSPGLATWLNTDQLIRRFFLIANDFSQNQRVTSHISFLRLQDPFYVMQEGENLFIAPKSYQRYKLLTDAINAVDAKKAAHIYLRFRPLLLQVFNELGYPKDITLESIIKKAAGEIISAPIITDPIMLIRPSVYYRFADPKLEAFNPVHKQMLRMGPDNTRVIQAKCREFLVELGKLGIK